MSTDEPDSFTDLTLSLTWLDSGVAKYGAFVGEVDVQVTIGRAEWERRNRPTNLPVTLNLGTAT